ncbi:MAG: rSAM/selenodomain-associated transferase 2 [Candidatus Omnitrophota bacterium]|jgi:rSAM/selenodomain-associated transferase 2
MISIIIPILNEEHILTEKQDYFLNLKERLPIIFVDGGSSDNSVAIAQKYGSVIQTTKGRAHQKNVGANFATEDVLLFLHVDSFITNSALKHLQYTDLSGYVGGCFTMNILDTRKVFRLYERCVNNRAKKNGLIDGDLGLFVKKKNYEALGGFKLVAIMDDIEFSDRLRKMGQLKYFNEYVNVSSRRWDSQGFISTLWRYTLAYVQYHTGIKFFK